MATFIFDVVSIYKRPLVDTLSERYRTWMLHVCCIVWLAIENVKSSKYKKIKMFEHHRVARGCLHCCKSEQISLWSNADLGMLEHSNPGTWNLSWVIMSAILTRMPKFKRIALGGASRHMGGIYHSRVVSMVKFLNNDAKITKIVHVTLAKT